MNGYRDNQSSYLGLVINRNVRELSHLIQMHLSSHPILKHVRLANPHHILLTIGDTSVKDSKISDGVTAQRDRLATVTPRLS